METEVSNDKGSRKDREDRRKTQKINEIVSVLEKRENYQKAIEKAEKDAKILFEEEEEEDLYQVLARTRKLAEVQRKKNEEIIAEQIEKIKKEDKTTPQTATDSWPALFSR